MARHYQKKNLEYWDRRKSTPATPALNAAALVAPAITVTHQQAAAPAIRPTPFADIEYGATEVRRTAFGQSVPASTSNYRGGGGGGGGYGREGEWGYPNLSQIPLPWASFGDNLATAGGGGGRQYQGMKNAIELCARAYVGVPIFRNAVEVAVEFSNQELYIKTDNTSMKTFFQEWFKIIDIDKLKQDGLREYYRSGNVFFYKFSGKFGPAYYKNFQQSFGSKNNRIPIRYYLLNPANVFVPTGLSFPYTYVRLLSTYDIERLRTPQTEQDQQVYDDMPQFVKDQINVTSAYPLGIYLPMDPQRLRFMFYKKQSYEPLAVPMGYPILPDLEYKLALKQMDKSIAKTIEHAILLVTTGETASQYNGGNGINPNNIARLQNLFTNQTVGRVLVADFTTKAQWLIPPLENILGPEKYQIVNQDIQEGLQSIWGGGGEDGEKFANAQVRAKIFIQRLEEGQNVFLKEFLMPEIVQICDDMGFRTVPEIGFRKIDLDDDMIRARVYTTLAQFGILTAEQTINAIQTKVLPDADEMKAGQLQYQKDREKGLYLPLTGASLQDGQAPGGGGAGPSGGFNGRPPGTKTPQSTKKISPVGTKRGTAFSGRAYVENLKASESLMEEIGSKLKKRFKIKELNQNQQSVATALARSIMATQPREKWTKSVAKAMEKPTAISAETEAEIDSISEDYDVDLWDATLLRLSRTKPILE